jgi:hypothetical protein
VRCNFNAILSCISFMAKGIEHFFRYLLTICTPFKNCLFSSFSHLFNGLILWEVSFLSFLYFLVINPLSDI